MVIFISVVGVILSGKSSFRTSIKFSKGAFSTQFTLQLIQCYLCISLYWNTWFQESKSWTCKNHCFFHTFNIIVNFTRKIRVFFQLQFSVHPCLFNLYLAEQEGSQILGTCVLCTHEKFVSQPDWKIGDSEYASICFHHLVVWQRVR